MAERARSVSGTGAGIHPLSDVQSVLVGEGTRIWQYCVVLPRARIGRNCNICAGCFVENDVMIGDNVTIKNGVYLWDGIVLEDDVFVGPNVTFSNDKYPVSGNSTGYTVMRTCVGKGAVIGAGAVILPGITIGKGALVAAGAIVTRDVPAGMLAIGQPAQLKEQKIGNQSVSDH